MYNVVVKTVITPLTFKSDINKHLIYLIKGKQVINVYHSGTNTTINIFVTINALLYILKKNVFYTCMIKAKKSYSNILLHSGTSNSSIILAQATCSLLLVKTYFSYLVKTYFSFLVKHTAFIVF